MRLNRYRKAIVVAVATGLATTVAIVRGDDPSSIPETVQLLIGGISTFLVWLIPNAEE